MQKIYKYGLLGIATIIELPQESTVLHAAFQRERICLWIAVTDKPTEQRHFVLIPTGGEVPEGGKYISTAITGDDRYVFHVYEVPHA